ncbi:MAG: tetratricopeptide repeat protein [Pseudomonadota bacterium]
MRNILIFLCAIALVGCVSTGPKPLEKWETEKRAKAHIDLGLNYLRRGELETAQEEMELALSINPGSSRASHGMGLISARNAEPQDALKWFARAVRQDRTNFTAVNDYGIQLCQTGQTDKGIKQLMPISEVRENNAVVATYLGLGICHHRQQQLDLAQGYYRRALQGSPTLPQALLPMAEISKAENKPLIARAFLERYFAAGAISPKALLLAAQVEVQLNDKERARLYARELRAQFPKAPEVNQLKALL